MSLSRIVDSIFEIRTNFLPLILSSKSVEEILGLLKKKEDNYSLNQQYGSNF